MQVLSNGIVLFENCFNFSEEIILHYEDLKISSLTDHYNLIKDGSGKYVYGINKSGHRIPFEDIDKTCVRISNSIEKESPRCLLQLEEITYKFLIKYIEIYPQVLPCLWWKTKGHGLVYSAGSSLGLHSDNDINYMPGAEPDYQIGIRHVLACICYFNTSGVDYDGGEIVFPYHNIKLKPKAGNILFFPANFLAAHEVAPIGSGSRYSYLEYYGHGSSDPARGLNIVDDSEYVKSGQVWLRNLPNDYRKYIISKYGESNLGELLRPIRNNYTSNNVKEELNEI